MSRRVEAINNFLLVKMRSRGAGIFIGGVIFPSTGLIPPTYQWLMGSSLSGGRLSSIAEVELLLLFVTVICLILFLLTRAARKNAVANLIGELGELDFPES
ncbi:hypothetical protein HN588_12600 [Candidatus Bathyarchaeota archaeon]|jgi:hypothetical protein|nr:hypothetical protein [Candidatus Bathyarchaeota archaeon]